MIIKHQKPIVNDLPELGDTIDSTDDYTIIDYDFDLYDEESGKVVARFRKDLISEKEKIEKFIQANRVLFKRLKESRGAAAGNINRDKLRKSVGELINTHKYRTGYIKADGTKSNTNICNLAKSNTIGFVETPKRAGNCLSGIHLAKYNIDYPQRYIDSLPLIEQISSQLESIDKKTYENNKIILKKECAMGASVFSSATLNCSWQSAVHRDANNGHDSMAVMTVLHDPVNENKYTGGYFVMPEFKIAFNVTHSDILIADTCKYLHGNSPLEPVEPSKIIGKYSAQEIKNNWHLNRLSVVCYIKGCCCTN